MQRSVRLLLAFVAVVLFGTLPATTGTAAGPTTALAPPFAAKHTELVPVPLNGVATASATLADGGVAAHTSIANPNPQGENWATAVLTVPWTATFTGTAVFTATLQLTGTMSAKASSPPLGSESATAAVVGGVRATGPGLDKTHSKTLESLKATCGGTVVLDGKPCNGNKSRLLDDVSKQVQLSVPVQKGQAYRVVVRIKVSAQAGGSSLGTSGLSADTCLSGGTITCPMSGRLSSGTHVASLTVQQG